MENLIPRAEMSRLRIALVAAVSACFVLGTIAVDILRPAPTPDRGQAAARQVESRRRSASFHDGSLARLIEAELRERSGVQFQIVPFWAAALLRWGRHGNDSVVIGEGPWLFARARVDVPEDLLDGGAGLGASAVAAVHRRLAARGVDYAPAVLPRKSVIGKAHLPAGMAVHEDFEDELERQLALRGVRSISVLDRWRSMPAAEVYQAADTHWNLGGRVEYAKAVRERFASIAEPLPEIAYDVREAGWSTDLMGILGIRGSESAAALVERPPNEALALDLGLLNRSIAGARNDGVITQVGTSFSTLADLRGLLSYMLGRHVAVRGWGGRTPSEPFVLFLREKGLDGLPDHLIHEIPLALFMKELSQDGLERKWLARQFNELPLPRAKAIELGTEVPLVLTNAPGDPVRATTLGSRLLTSTDGVVSVRIDAPDSAPFSMRVGVGDFWLDAERVAGDGTPVDVPIIAPFGFTGRVQVFARAGPTRRLDIDVELVTDADLDAVRPFPGEGAEPGLDVARLETLVVRGQLIGDVEIAAAGVDAAGAPQRLSWRFSGAGAPLALLSVAAFEGGRIESVDVQRSGGGPIEVGLAPWLGAEASEGD